MHASLRALTDELKRLKASGVKSLAVSEDSLARLRTAVAARTPAAAPPPAGSTRPEAPVTVPEYRAPVRTFAAKPVPPPESPLPAPVPFTLPDGDKAARWAALRDRILGDPVCRAQVRPGKQVVFGVGSLEAKIMFVGEAPGAEEEVQGEPFVGPAGQLLTKMINGMGLKREEVYIGNIMNWRPAMPADERGVQYGNRPPTAPELAYCLPYLKAQIEVVNPGLLVALGPRRRRGFSGPTRSRRWARSGASGGSSPAGR